MPRRSQQHDVPWLISQINHALSTFAQDHTDLSLRQKVQKLVPILHHVKDLGVSIVREAGLDSGSARERLRLYLVEYVGQHIPGEELEVVAGISEYARRLRELRVEDGYQITSGATPDPESGIDLSPDEYLLVKPEPDQDAARRWHIANRIRKGTGGARERLLLFLQENVGRVVTTEELAYVAREARAFARRVRELRTEHGFAISTCMTGRPDLAPGQYVLESLERVIEPHDRNIPPEIERSVYERDQNTCRLCGWNRDRWTVIDQRILELHHLQEHVERGPNTEENLIVICSKCHDDVHAGRRTIPFITA